MTWFERLTGFPETSPQQVRANLSVDGNRLHSHINGGVWVCGALETPSLAELRARVRASARLWKVGAMKERSSTSQRS